MKDRMKRLSDMIIFTITKSDCTFEEIQTVLKSVMSINEQAYLGALDQVIKDKENV